ncbi:MAG: Ig-like domain-containing protein, partial [Bifidobacteriaceae bacterium]|nr:Ig-like domain-containing protein [Bifidobacteriaceae bacterium]
TAPHPPAVASQISEFAYAQAKFGAILGRPRIADALAEDFAIKQVTLPELFAVLETPGEHNVLISGTWCADSKEAIGNVVAAAQTHAAGEPLWWFDFQFDGVHDGFSAIGSDAPGNASGLAYLGARLLDGYLTGLHAHFAGGSLRYFPDGDPAQPLATTAVPRFRSPALFRVASGGGVTRQWIRQLTAQDVQDARWGDPTGPWDGHEGDYVEYEYASGGLTPAIRTAGWVELATFFDPAYQPGPSSTPTDDAGPSSSPPPTSTGGPGKPAAPGVPDGASEAPALPPSRTGTLVGGVRLAALRAPITTVRVVLGASVTIPIIGEAPSGGASKAAVTWTSSKLKVASIAVGKRSGIVRVPVGRVAKVTIKALRKGTTNLTLRAEGRTLRVKVIVVGAKVKPGRLTIGPKNTRLKTGHSLALTAAPTNRKATGIVPRWTSSNPKVAAVDAAGRLTAKSNGRATITVRAGGVTARRTVRVT